MPMICGGMPSATARAGVRSMMLPSGSGRCPRCRCEVMMPKWTGDCPRAPVNFAFVLRTKAARELAMTLRQSFV